MEVLGYIVSKTKTISVIPCIKIVSNYNNIEDKTKPILIVGLEEAKKYASSFSILNKKLDKNLFWTFGKREKRCDFEKDIVLFQDFVLKNVFNNIKYYYFNVIKQKYSKIKDLINIIKYDNNNIFYLDKKMIYLYKNDYIIGFSCDMLEYIGLKKRKILNLIQSNDKNTIFFNDFNMDYKIKSIINDKKYITPYFLSLKLNK